MAEANIQLFKPLLREGLPHVAELACARDGEGVVIGFIGVTGEPFPLLHMQIKGSSDMHSEIMPLEDIEEALLEQA